MIDFRQIKVYGCTWVRLAKRLLAQISETLSRKRSLRRGSLRSFEGLKREALLVGVAVVRLGVRDALLLSADAFSIEPVLAQLSGTIPRP